MSFFLSLAGGTTIFFHWCCLSLLLPPNGEGGSSGRRASFSLFFFLFLSLNLLFSSFCFLFSFFPFCGGLPVEKATLSTTFSPSLVPSQVGVYPLPFLSRCQHEKGKVLFLPSLSSISSSERTGFPQPEGLFSLPAGQRNRV